MSVAISMRELLDAGVHFGHQTQRWHPGMKAFIYGERNGIHIINLQYTLPRFRAAIDFLRETVAEGGKVLFVGTKRQAQSVIQEAAQASGMPYVHRRWLGGMLTNFRTVRKGIDRYKDLNTLLGDEDASASLSKKERAQLVREQQKLHKAFEGIADMESLPDAIFVVDIRHEHIAIKEAQRLGIPIVAVVDSNCDPEGIEFVVPGNDDAIRALGLYAGKASEACKEGLELFNARIVEEGRAQPAEAEEEVVAPGKRVVEITQPARRPARMEREAQRVRRELEEAEAARREAERIEAAATGEVEEPEIEEPPAEEPAAEEPANEEPAAAELQVAEQKPPPPPADD